MKRGKRKGELAREMYQLAWTNDLKKGLLTKERIRAFDCFKLKFLV
jgi:hypothetical protein